MDRTRAILPARTPDELFVARNQEQDDIMHTTNFRTFGLLTGGIVAGLALTAVQGCDDVPGSDICGPCGTIAGGSLSISGSAQLDGFFNATGQLNAAFLQIRGQFEADVRALASLYPELNVTADTAIDGAFVGKVKAAIQADFAASLDGGIKVVYKAPQCSANVSVAVDAQAKCEVQGGCDVKVDPGSVSVVCEGGCSGSCEGTCSGEASCAVKAPSVKCEGTCEGSCTVEAGAACEGTCRGDCDGSCSAEDGNGKCAGTCDGMCMGTCELKAAAKCEGTCSGSCLVEPGSASCTAEAECRGSCEGTCSGSCTGKATPPSASAKCDASADCQAQASAQASASLECTPPSLDLQYRFSAALEGDVKAQGAFLYRVGEIRVRGAAILQGFARLGALIDGKIDGKVVFDPSPLAQISASLQGVVSAGVDGDLFANVPKGRLLCVIPAMQAAVKTLASVGTEASATISAQADFATLFTGK